LAVELHLIVTAAFIELEISMAPKDNDSDGSPFANGQTIKGLYVLWGRSGKNRPNKAAPAAVLKAFR
jgi:hypothetical protein